MSNPTLTPTEKAADRAGAMMFFAIAAVLVAALAAGFITLGVPGVTLVMLALVPVVYLLLVLMSFGR